jgi:hypothetical protein
MVESSYLAKRDDLSEFPLMHRSRLGRVLLERKMSS